MSHSIGCSRRRHLVLQQITNSIIAVPRRIVVGLFSVISLSFSEPLILHGETGRRDRSTRYLRTTYTATPVRRASVLSWKQRTSLSGALNDRDWPTHL